MELRRRNFCIHLGKLLDRRGLPTPCRWYRHCDLLNTKVTTGRDCQLCEHYSADTPDFSASIPPLADMPAIEIQRSQQSGEWIWSIGITTSPIWDSAGNAVGLRPTLEGCIRSVVAAGWGTDDITIFAEPGAQPVDGVRCVRRATRFGSWQNWFQGLQQLVGERPEANAYLMVQDDATLCMGIRAYLESNPLVEGASVLSLYRSGKHAGGKPGWQRINGFVWGAVAYAIPRDSVLAILGDAKVHEHSGNKIDLRISRWCQRNGGGMWVHNPSLADHAHGPSSIGHGTGGASMRALNFPGADFDARYLIGASS